VRSFLFIGTDRAMLVDTGFGNSGSLKKLISISDAFDTLYPAHSLFPLNKSQISICLRTAEKLSLGDLTPQEPPTPAKMHRFEGASFFYN